MNYDVRIYGLSPRFPRGVCDLRCDHCEAKNQPVCGGDNGTLRKTQSSEWAERTATVLEPEKIST